jgi:hypothetical protein
VTSATAVVAKAAPQPVAVRVLGRLSHAARLLLDRAVAAVASVRARRARSGDSR